MNCAHSAWPACCILLQEAAESKHQRLVLSSVITVILQANVRVIKSSISRLLWPSGKFYFSKFNSLHVTDVLLEKRWLPFKTCSSWLARTLIGLCLQLRLTNHWHKSDKHLIASQIIPLLSFWVSKTYFLAHRNVNRFFFCSVSWH